MLCAPAPRPAKWGPLAASVHTVFRNETRKFGLNAPATCAFSETFSEAKKRKGHLGELTALRNPKLLNKTKSVRSTRTKTHHPLPRLSTTGPVCLWSSSASSLPFPLHLQWLVAQVPNYICLQLPCVWPVRSPKPSAEHHASAELMR